MISTKGQKISRKIRDFIAYTRDMKEKIELAMKKINYQVTQLTVEPNIFSICLNFFLIGHKKCVHQ